MLALVGVAFILVAVGILVADVREAGGTTAVAREEPGSPPPSPGDRAPQSRTMWLTVPEMKRAENVPVYNAPMNDEDALHDGALHVQSTGFPWQREANVYIAGHRLGYPRTDSFLVFWDLNRLERGDAVRLRDSEGRVYVYSVFERSIVPPSRVSAKKPVEGKNIVSLQTCTLPDYSERLVVRAELVRTERAPAGPERQRERRTERPAAPERAPERTPDRG